MNDTKENVFKRGADFLQKYFKYQKALSAIDVELKVGAREAIQKYQAECADGRSEALIQLRDVIRPWWSDIEKQGLDQAIMHLVQLGYLRYFPVADPIKHYYPKQAFERVAGNELIINGQGHEFFVRNGEVDWVAVKNRKERYAQSYGWEANFGIFKPSKDAFSGLGVDIEIPRPPVKYAQAIHRGRFPVNFVKPQRLLDQVHPQVVIGLGQQIQTGRVWEVIDRQFDQVQNTNLSSSKIRNITNFKG